LVDCCDVLVNTASGPVLLMVDSTGFQSNGVFYFKEDTSSNCLGTKYLVAQGVFSTDVVDKTTGTVYVATALETLPLSMHSQSFMGRCQPINPPPAIYGAAVPVSVSGFAPPFSVK